MALINVSRQIQKRKVQSYSRSGRNSLCLTDEQKTESHYERVLVKRVYLFAIPIYKSESVLKNKVGESYHSMN
jgi:hypothetical protein